MVTKSDIRIFILKNTLISIVLWYGMTYTYTQENSGDILFSFHKWNSVEGWSMRGVFHLWAVFTRYPPWCCRPLQPRCPSLWSVPLVWCPGSAAPPGSRWTLGAPAAASLGERQNKNSSGCVRWIFSTAWHGLFYQHVFWGSYSPASLSLTPVRGGSFLGTAPGITGISTFSITTPLSVVPFDTAESPRPSSLLPVSSWQHRDTTWMQKHGTRHFYILTPFCMVSQTSCCHGNISVLTDCHEHSSSGTIMIRSR